jgi:hypothetical protein
VEHWELVARECIRDRIARWNAHGDAGRSAEMVDVLAPDAEFEAPGSGLLRGRAAVLEFLTGVRDAREGPERAESVDLSAGPYLPSGTPPSIRHLTSTTHIRFTSRSAARVRTYYMVLTSFGLDHWGRYLDDFTLADGTWPIARRVITTDGMAPGGWAAQMAPPPPKP